MINFNKNAAPGGKDDDNNKTLGGQVFVIDILEIETSHINPRKTQGDNYDSTKKSIKEVGLLQMLTVTKQPDAENYELYSGGNTRLTILKELHDEYLADGDEDNANKIRYQQCLYVPYTNDLDVLVKHMAENEERSNMTFIDKARAVFQIKAMYLQQENLDDISNRKLVKYIHQLGWTRVNQRSMTELTFAFEKIDDVIPLALNQGMGRPKIEQLRKWLYYAVTYVSWLVEKHGYDYSAEQAEQLYFTVLATYDDDIDPINLDEFYQEYLFQLSNILMKFDSKLKMEVVRFEFEQIKELGYVPEEKPVDELSRQLKETSTVPPFQYPEPRKPRTPKTETITDSHETAGTGNHIGESDESNNMLGGIAAKVNPATNANSNIETATDSENSIAEIGKHQTIQLFEKIIPQYDLLGTLREENLLLYGDEDNSLHIYPPYFSLDISDENKYRCLTKIILSAEWPLQYLVLHILYVFVTYYKNDFDHNSLSKDETITFKNLMKIWGEFCTKYCHYTGLCETGLIMRNILQGQSMMEVHNLIRKNLDYIANFELSIIQDVNSDKDKGGG